MRGVGGGGRCAAGGAVGQVRGWGKGTDGKGGRKGGVAVVNSQELISPCG